MKVLSDSNCTMYEADEFKKGGYFPFEYITGFLEFLNRHKDIIQIITYKDLSWGNDFNYQNSYRDEYKRWTHELKNGQRDYNKIYVLLQHDVDSRAERTTNLLQVEEQLEIPSNVMIFVRRHNRKTLKSTGKLMFTEYPINYEYLKKLEKQGFLVCYHSNAYEQSLFDEERAYQIFEKDIATLREHFPLYFFSAHGGVPGSDGRNNRDLGIPKSLRTSIRWVHNGASPYFDETYSDGGINSLQRDPAKRDLRDFVRRWQRGKRYRVLLHPQYYNSPCNPSPRLQGTPWYDEILEGFDRNSNVCFWEDDKFPF